MTGEIHMVIFAVGFLMGFVSAKLLNGGMK